MSILITSFRIIPAGDINHDGKRDAILYSTHVTQDTVIDPKTGKAHHAIGDGYEEKPVLVFKNKRGKTIYYPFAQAQGCFAKDLKPHERVDQWVYDTANTTFRATRRSHPFRPYDMVLIGGKPKEIQGIRIKLGQKSGKYIVEAAVAVFKDCSVVALKDLKPLPKSKRK